MIKPVFKTIIKTKPAKIALAFSAFPLILIVVGLFKTNFMQIHAKPGSLSFLDFFAALLNVQFQSTLPVIAFIYLIVNSINDEISNGLLYLFKDIKRSKILNSKIFSLLLIYYIYFAMTFVTSLFTYYSYLITQSYTSGKFLPSTSDIQYDLIVILGVFLMSQIIIILAIALSINFKNGTTLILSTVFVLVSFMASHLTTLKYFFPTGYSNDYQNFGFLTTILIMLLISIIYSGLFYIIANKTFNHLEY